MPVVAVGKPGTKSMDNISWQSLLSVGATVFVKHLVFSMFEQSKTTGSMDRAWQAIMWSFVALFLGLFPKKNWQGADWPAGSSEAYLASQASLLAGGFFFVIWSIKGDLDWYLKGLGLKSYNAHAFC